LLAREFCWRKNADVIIEVPLAATAWVGETFAFDPEDGAALCAFGDFKSFFAVEARDLEFGAKSSLRDAQRDRAVEISPAALKEGMFLNVQDDVEIAWRAAVGSGFAFASDAEARAGVHAGRNAKFDGLFALNAALTVAIGATFANNLSRALASGACARDGKETLLIGELAAATAGLAGDNAGTFFCAGSVASSAVLLAGQLDFSGNAGRCLFKSERHVIAQIGPALFAGTAGAPGGEEIFETKEVEYRGNRGRRCC
jgi:hypothetical protein